MKINRTAMLLALVFLSSCSGVNYWKLRVSVPTKAEVDLASYKKIFVTNFLIQEETEGFDLNKEIVDYLSYEMRRQFNETVSTKEVPLENEDIFSDKEFWKNFSSEDEGLAYLTGSAMFFQEVRKAILETRKARTDDPFPRERALAERRFFNLTLNLYLIDGSSGETLFSRSFKESRGYENPKQTAFFAFFDLIQRVKEKLFSDILGGLQIQERYLITD